MLVTLLRLLGRLPLSVLYRTLSPTVSFLLYRFPGYRRKIVQQNIANSFPDMPAGERHALEKRYYQHLGQLTAEILRAQWHDAAELQQRVTFKNLELVEQAWSENRPIMIMALHQGNWEWLLQAGNLAITPTVSLVYKPLHNEAMDHYFLEGRTRFGCICIPHKQVLKDLDNWISPFCFCLLADQAPMKKTPKAWATMMGQDTAFPLGAEIIAEKTDPVILFCKMHQTRLGHYEVEMQPLAEPPYELDEHRIMKRYAELATESITEQPHTWLWSNRRWRYGKD